jgi:hypothetical protein
LKRRLLTEGGATILSGKKTYIVAVALGLATFARALGLIDDQSFTAIQGLLAATGLATLRAGVGN